MKLQIICFIFQVISQNFSISYKKLKMNFIKPVSSKSSQATQEIVKSTKSLRLFGRLGWKPKRENLKSNAIIFLNELKKIYAFLTRSANLAVHHRRMLFVATNAGSIYALIATLKSTENFSLIVGLICHLTTNLLFLGQRNS